MWLMKLRKADNRLAFLVVPNYDTAVAIYAALRAAEVPVSAPDFVNAYTDPKTQAKFIQVNGTVLYLHDRGYGWEAKPEKPVLPLPPAPVQDDGDNEASVPSDGGER